MMSKRQLPLSTKNLDSLILIINRDDGVREGVLTISFIVCQWFKGN